MDKRINQIKISLAILLLFGGCALGETVGLIVPHHLLAKKMIQQAFSAASFKKYDAIILIGPNHKNIGPFNAATSQKIWEFGDINVYPDERVIKRLADNKLLGISENFILQEHSIFPLINIVKDYFPKSKILPIMFKAYAWPEEISLLAESLSKLKAGKDILIIASVDFSHKTTAKNALISDSKSIPIISSFDFEKIYSLNLDSKPSIYFLLKMLALNHSKQAILLNNLNALDFSDKADQDDVTSYASFLFLNNKKKVAEITVGGDVMLGRGVAYMSSIKKDFIYPFRGIADLFKKTDFSVVNLEGPFASKYTSTNEAYKLSHPKEAIGGLVFSGIDLVSLANNHIFDLGIEGLDFTKKLLDENGIMHCSESDIIYKTINGQKFAFLGANCLDKEFDPAKYSLLISEAKKNADLAVVFPHWGSEYRHYPELPQKKYARIFIEAGADLVLGSHPHYIQGFEYYKDKLIVYSHGNLVFDQALSKDTSEGIVGKYKFFGGRLIGFEFVPIKINKDISVFPARSNEAMEILLKTKEFSTAYRDIGDQEGGASKICRKRKKP